MVTFKARYQSIDIKVSLSDSDMLVKTFSHGFVSSGISIVR